MLNERDFTAPRRDRNRALDRTGRDPAGNKAPAESRDHQALRLLRRLYVFRVTSSVAWVTAIVVIKGSADAGGSITLIAAALAAYPALDGLAALVDLRIPSSAAVQRLLRCNLAAGLAAASLVLVPSGGTDPKIRVFGVWAIVSGGIQLLVAASRRAWLKRQWLMIISGAGSVIAGLTFAAWAGSGPAGLSALEQYSLGGAAWYLITAAWLLATSREVSNLGDELVPTFE